jgi:hypothetical protein
MRNFTLVSLVMICAAVAGCTRLEDPQQFSCAYPTTVPVRIYKKTLAELTYAAIDKMTLCGPPEISQIVPITVSSITESQHLDRSSAFGNIVADFARSRLAQNRMDVLEPRLRSSMLLKADQGEIMLGRDPRSLVASPSYAAVVAGTYGVGDTSVFVNLKLIRADNAQILSAADFIVWRDGDIKNLLGDLSIAGNR